MIYIWYLDRHWLDSVPAVQLPLAAGLQLLKHAQSIIEVCRTKQLRCDERPHVLAFFGWLQVMLTSNVQPAGSSYDCEAWKLMVTETVLLGSAFQVGEIVPMDIAFDPAWQESVEVAEPTTGSVQAGYWNWEKARLRYRDATCERQDVELSWLTLQSNMAMENPE